MVTRLRTDQIPLRTDLQVEHGLVVLLDALLEPLQCPVLFAEREMGAGQGAAGKGIGRETLLDVGQQPPRRLSFAKTRSMSWSIELRVPPVLGAPRAREGRHRGRCQPERVDHPQMLETAFGAGFAKQVLGDVETSCRLRRRE